MTDDQKQPDAYLGDGVYASFDGYQIWLKTERETGWHAVALEPQCSPRCWSTPGGSGSGAST